MRVRNAARLAAGLFAVAVLAGACVPRTPRAPKVREIVFWEAWPSASLAPLVAGFEAANPGTHIVLKALDPATGRDSIALALHGGQAPDLCQIPSEDMPRWLSEGVLSDWSAGVADLRDSLYGWPLCMVGDAIYGLPWVLEDRALLWDRELFARAGLPPDAPPATWDELRTAAARIQRLGGGVHGIGLPDTSGDERMGVFMALAAGDTSGMLSASFDSSCAGSPRKIAAAALLGRLRRSALVAPRDSLDRAFGEGRLGMVVGDGALLRRLAASSPARRVGAGPIPAATAGEPPATLARGEVLASFTASRHKEDALRLARFLMRPENVIALAASAPGLLPANAGADSAAAFRDRPAERAMLAQLPRARFVPNHPRWPEMQASVARAVGMAFDGDAGVVAAFEAADSAVTDLAAHGRR
jgi:multiple sugar transport system substrate-binding protein